MAAVLGAGQDVLTTSLSQRMLQLRQAHQRGDKLTFILYNEIEYSLGNKITFGVSLNWIIIYAVLLALVGVGVVVTLVILQRRQLT